MRSVVVLALLWQAAVVLGLGAIHAPDNNNNRASSSSWVLKEVWSTDITTQFPFSNLFTSANGEELYMRTALETNQNCNSANNTMVSINGNTGKEQWESGPVGGCGTYWRSFVPMLPYVASMSDRNVTVFDVKASGSVLPIHTYRSALSGIVSSGSHFYWLTSAGKEGTLLTKVDPRTGATSMSKVTIPRGESRFSAGLNYLFLHSNAEAILTCFSAVTGDVAWSVAFTNTMFFAPNRVVYPSPSKEVVLVDAPSAPTNELGSLTLYNSTNGAVIWKSRDLPDRLDKVYYFGDVVVLSSPTPIDEVSSSNSFTAVQISTGTVLWSSNNRIGRYSPSQTSCTLDSGILVISIPGSGLYSVDILTGKTSVFSGTTSMELQHCFQNDVFTVAGNNLHYIVKRFKVAPPTIKWL